MLLLSACTTTEVIHDKVPVPVPCVVSVEKIHPDIETKSSKILEEQTAIYRKSISQQSSYITILESNIVGCGGKIIDK